MLRRLDDQALAGVMKPYFVRALIQRGALRGTAINLFVRDMPGLSVDLDLVFVDHMAPRAEAFGCINEAMRESVAAE